MKKYIPIEDEIFMMSTDTELTDDLLKEYIQKHQALCTARYQLLKDAYNTKYPIFEMDKKENGKPDNRIAVNFAKYMVDTMNGFFIGNPIKVTSADVQLAEYIELLDRYNDQDDNNAELSRITSIYGKGYEYYFVDESKQLGITYLNPMEGFMIYDDTVLQRPLYFVTYGASSNEIAGSVHTKTYTLPFVQSGADTVWSDPILHGFQDVPFSEYLENEERSAIFESVITLINSYNKAISEKANDVDYFADAYMKLLGAELDGDTLKHIRDNRIINLSGDDAEKLVVEFMDKPNADTTQENLISRLERLIYQISMVANINDENFGSSTGIALKYKLQSMSNLAKTKERKFTSGMVRRYKVIASNLLSNMKENSWMDLEFRFTPNFPANLLEESEIAGNLAGITSSETQLKVISAVGNVREEIERIKSENDTVGYDTDYPTNRLGE